MMNRSRVIIVTTVLLTGIEGAGNFTGSSTTVQPSPDSNAATPQVRAGEQFTGTYMVNADGAGTLKVPNPAGRRIHSRA
jgi:hypothetical protein